MLRDKHEEISHRSIPRSAPSERTTGDLGGNPEIGGSSAIEIERLARFPASDRVVADGISQSRQGAWRAAADPPARPSIPENEGAGAGFCAFETADRFAILDQNRSCLDQLVHCLG